MVPPMVRLSLVTIFSLSLSACAPMETRNAAAGRSAEAGISEPVIIGGAVVLSSILLLLARNTSTVSTR